jgi:hypothetical protein
MGEFKGDTEDIEESLLYSEWEDDVDEFLR